MQIDLEILMGYGAALKRYKKGDWIFEEEQIPHSFFQVLEGSVKVISTNNDGKELIQKIFGAGESFGEPPLIINKPYPCAARAISDSVIIKLGKDAFFRLLDDFPTISRKLLVLLAQRIYTKSTKIQIMNTPTPKDKILAFLERLKTENQYSELQQIPYTRQQIADLIGLRVETVIRTLKTLDKAEKVKIINHKIYY